jgi:hypothetical protein
MSARSLAIAMLCVAGFALSRPGAAAAEPITIAAFEPPPPLSICCFGGGYQHRFSQSFIATQAGTITQVDVPLWAASPSNGRVSLALHRAESGVPVGPPLTARMISASIIPPSCCGSVLAYVSFRHLFAPVERGDQLALVFDGTSQAQWVFGDGYSDGFLSIAEANSDVWTRSFFGGSGSFRVLGEGAGTSPVPEPGTMVLLGTGILGLIRMRSLFGSAD